MPGTVLGTGDTELSKKEQNEVLVFHGFYDQLPYWWGWGQTTIRVTNQQDNWGQC